MPTLLLLLLTHVPHALAASSTTTTTTTTSAPEPAPMAPASASAIPPFKARFDSPELKGRGTVTIDADTIEIEVHHAFSVEDHVTPFGDCKSIHLRRTAFHTDILLDMKDGTQATFRARHRDYEMLKGALRGRITKG